MTFAQTRPLPELAQREASAAVVPDDQLPGWYRVLWMGRPLGGHFDKLADAQACADLLRRAPDWDRDIWMEERCR